MAVALRFADGSVASIAYGSTPPVAGKERIEVLAGSHQVIIDDFRSVLVNGRTLWKGRQDKGHRAHAAAFRQAVQGGPGMPTEAMLGTMRATIQAARARDMTAGRWPTLAERGTAVTAAVTVDAAGAQMGGAARYLDELRGYLARTGREDVEIIGSRRRVGPGWLLRRELSSRARSRRVALNNVGFVTPGGQRWTLLRNALHFLTEGEQARLDPALRASVRREAVVVHLAARRSDVIVAPSTAMAERIATVRPELSSRVVVRPHPVSAAPIAARCPVIPSSCARCCSPPTSRWRSASPNCSPPSAIWRTLRSGCR